jgi:hypothetical protein
MASFQITTCMLKDQTILASYIHPLTKKKVRKTFASGRQAQEYKTKIESQFNSTDINSYIDLNLEELMILFMNDKPFAINFF